MTERFKLNQYYDFEHLVATNELYRILLPAIIQHIESQPALEITNLPEQAAPKGQAESKEF